MQNPFEPINNRLINLETLISEALHLLRSHPTVPTSPDDQTPLTVQQAADFLNVSRQTVYQNKHKIPHRKRHGRLYFFKTELAAYLNQAA